MEKKYKNTFCKNSISIHNTDFNLYSLLYNEVYKVKEKSIYYTIKLLLDYLFFKYVKVSKTNNNSNLLLISYYHGNDKRDSQWNYIKTIFDNDNYDEMVVEFKKHSKIDINLIKKNLEILFSNLKKFKEVTTLKDKIFFAVKLSYLTELEKNLDLFPYNYKVGICFYDSGFFENLIVPYLRYIHKIKMVTFQYGQPIFYSSNSNLRNQSQIINFKSDLYLAKNNFTKKQLTNYGIDEDSIVIVGSHYKTNCKKEELLVKTNYTFGIFLDCVTHEFSEKSNNKMILLADEICKLTGYKCIIKPHPLDKKKYKYNKNHCVFVYESSYDFDEISQNIDFAIIHSSSIVLDLIEKKIKIFEYALNLAPIILNNSFDVFSNIDDFLDLLDKWNNLECTEKNNYFTNKIKEYIIPTNFEEKTRKTIHELL